MRLLRKFAFDSEWTNCATDNSTDRITRDVRRYIAWFLLEHAFWIRYLTEVVAGTCSLNNLVDELTTAHQNADSVKKKLWEKFLQEEEQRRSSNRKKCGTEPSVGCRLVTKLGTDDDNDDENIFYGPSTFHYSTTVVLVNMDDIMIFEKEERTLTKTEQLTSWSRNISVEHCVNCLNSAIHWRASPTSKALRMEAPEHKSL